MTAESRIAQFKGLLAAGLTQAEVLIALSEHGDKYPDAASEAHELATDDLEIDDHPLFSAAPDGSGVWVSAWVWIANQEFDPEQENADE